MTGTAVSARTPEDVDRLLAEAFRRNDLEALVALYEPGATLVAQPGQAVTGQTAIREVLQGFLALSPTLELEVIGTLRSGDVALLCSRWTLTGTTPDGQPVRLSGRGAEVVRQQADGSWRYVIDNPHFGA